MYSENMKIAETAEGPRGAVFGFLKGLGLAGGFTVVIFLLFAVLLTFTGLSEGMIPVISTVTQALGALIAGFMSAKGAGSRGFLSGVVAGALYVLFIWMIASLVGGGVYVGRHYLTMLGFSAFCGAIGGVLGVNLKSGRTNRRRR